MNISAIVKNKQDQHEAIVQTNGQVRSLSIAPKSTGFGSSVNGGELLLLSLATCFCNDLYREAGKRNIIIDAIEVECTGNFGAEGEPGFNFNYKTNVVSNAPALEIEELIRHTDKVAEIHNTLRTGLNITLTS